MPVPDPVRDAGVLRAIFYASSSSSSARNTASPAAVLNASSPSLIVSAIDASAIVVSAGRPRQRRGHIGTANANDSYLLLHGSGPFSGSSVLADPRTLHRAGPEEGSPPNYFNKTRDMLAASRHR